MWNWIDFGIGIFIGAFLGLFVAGLLQIARGNEKIEEIYREGENKRVIKYYSEDGEGI